MWDNIDKTRPDSAHYVVMQPQRGQDGMAALRGMFPDGEADSLNMVLFSTSGVHGTYNMIEEAEAALDGEPDGCTEVTYLILNPRLVALRYGVCEPQNADDIAWLKKLRASSQAQLAMVGMPQASNAGTQPRLSEARTSAGVPCSAADNGDTK